MATARDIAALLSSRMLDDSIVVAPTSGAGRQLLERLALEGNGWLRTRALTPGGLARTVLGDLHPACRGRISDAAARQYLHDICLSTLGEDSPFYPLRHSDGLHRALLDAYETCVHSGCDPASLPPETFENSVRGQLIPLLLGAFRTRLRRDGVFTGAEVIAEALNTRHPRISGAQLLIESVHADSLSLTEQRLLDRCGTVTRLESPAVSLQPVLKRAATDEFEIRGALRQILHSGIAADTCELVLARADLLPLCFELTRLYDLPATFDPGIPLHYSKASRTIVCWLRWLSSGYDAAHLIRMMYDGIPAPQDVLHENQRGGRLQMASLLRKSAAGWGRSRVLESVDRRIAAMEKSDREGSDKQVGIARANREWLRKLLEATPEEDAQRRLSLHAVARGARTIVMELCRDAYPGEKLALSGIADIMTELEQGPELFLPTREIALHLTALLRDGSFPMVLQSPGAEALPTTSPLPGHLHVSTLPRGGWSGRQHLFVLGCDAETLPGEVRQNPVFLDSERQRLTELTGATVPLSAAGSTQRTAAFHALLGRQHGNITLSWSEQSPVERRARSVSHLVLETFRSLRADPTLSHEDLYRMAGETIGLLPEDQPLTVAEWWLQQRSTADADSVAQDLRRRHPLHRAGHEALSARTGEEFTAWDGNVGQGNWDPSRPLSPSALEMFARCPYAFFLGRMLGARDPEPWIRPRDSWLTHLEHGTFMHELLQEFMQSFAHAGRRPESAEDLAALHTLAMTRLEDLKERIPCPSPSAFESERRRVLVECEITLRVQEKLPGHPFLLEAGFGMPHGDNVCGEITLPTAAGNILLRGQIDRVDQTGEQSYAVWDYKTGTDFTRAADPYKQGRSLQHGLYSLAAADMMKALGRAVADIQAGYLFISERTQGKAVPVSGDPAALQAILDQLATLLSEGSFPHSVSADDCRFCDFASVCVYPLEVTAQSRDKMDVESNTSLEAFRRLRDA